MWLVLGRQPAQKKKKEKEKRKAGQRGCIDKIGSKIGIQKLLEAAKYINTWKIP